MSLADDNNVLAYYKQSLDYVHENITDNQKSQKNEKHMQGWNPKKLDGNDTTTLSHHPYILYHFAATYTNMLCVFVSCDRQTDMQTDIQTDRQTDRQTDGQTDQQKLTLALIGLRIQCPPILTPYTIRNVIGSIYAHCAPHDFRRTCLWNDKEMKQ